MVDFFEKDFKKEELNETLKQCIEAKGVKNLLPLRMFNMAKEEFKREKFEETILEILGDDKKCVKEIVKIDDETAIVKTHQQLFGEDRDWFIIYYKGQIEGIVTTKYEIALLRVVALKQGCAEATQWMAKMIGLEEDIDE